MDTARQSPRQFHQIGAANMQHGCDQQRQLVPLRFALPRQALVQVSLDPFRSNGDPARSNHLSIPLQKRSGNLASYGDWGRQPYAEGN